MALNIREILKDKDRRRGMIGATVVHLLLLVALVFLALRTPLPLPGEEGVEVNLGYDDAGFGDIQTESPPQQTETPPLITSSIGSVISFSLGVPVINFATSWICNKIAVVILMS